ncbi:YfhO family protein [Enterococcus xiangfangensis]|uniref:YfhO family protein n=1 Tax=Enterococcus xiangfangensis TaxID=1296537 RepID=UPI0010F9AB37|nr:YfhO family protein [Enterococcus xiangfangensis]MBM7711888.1 putative membrane protein YfhO [Enterococcus xiangfangensis]NBK08145.1 copper ABC transporter permease [Enterococcus asini]
MKNYLKKNRWYLLASFFLPLVLMVIVYLTIGIYPGSSRSVLASDAFSQFSNFHASFRNMLLGKQGLFYNWSASMGLNYLSLISYYLGGFFTPLVLFFPNQLMPDALYFLTLLKIGSAGLAFWFYAKGSFKLPDWSRVALSVSYALMSFTIAHSEIIMWLDAFVYLPLIIWGINRVMDFKKPTVLFVSYLMLFLTSFYMGFMIGIFSVLYFIARLLTNWRTYKKSIIPYGITSLLAGFASMIMILPSLLDLRTNGEELTKITTFKTEATDWWDFIAKNLIGSYDTTKYGSIPFIYIGLLPLALCLFYFICKKIPWKNKILYGAVAGILIASFYIQPLNLFWQGMHAPNMFLFRYAYLLSFLVITLAAWGWEKLARENVLQLVAACLLLIACFAIFWGMKGKDYSYLKPISLYITLGFLAIYALLFTGFHSNKIPVKTLSLLLLVLMCAEAAVNSDFMVRGILKDWNYASRSLYTEPYPAIKNLVDKTKTDNDDFYRLENLDPVSANDSFNYGYNGISMFSSIRNRHSSGYMDQLGFRSRGTSLNIRYQNNTLLADAFTGIKYNIAKAKNLNKYGFTKTDSSGEYHLFENNYALPLAFLAPTSIDKLQALPNDNLGTQTQLFNALSQEQFQYFQFLPMTQVRTKNATVTNAGTITTITEKQSNVSKDVTWKVQVPANTQAYLSLYPYDFSELESSTATITAAGQTRQAQISISGQYYDLGYYPKATTVTFTASFYGTKSISFQNPQVLALDTIAYHLAIDKIKENGVAMKTGKQSAEGTVTTEKAQTLITTIPYDKGWTAKIDGKKVKTKAFQNAFISIHVPKGKHKITFSYLPQGLTIGAISFVLSIGLFLLYLRILKPKKGHRH